MRFAMKRDAKGAFGRAWRWTGFMSGVLVLAVTPLRAQAPQQSLPQDSSSGIPFQVVPEREAVLSSQMMSRVESIHFKLGDSVTAGQTLVVFDCRELEAKRASTVAELMAAQDTHHSKLRLQGLGAAGELEVALAASGVVRGLANVAQIDASLINCKLVAPFSGDISKLRVKEKEVVAPNQAVLDIVDMQNLKLVMYLPASMSRQVAIDTLVAVEINGDSRSRTARVSRINPRIDGASQTLEVEAVLVEPMPGLKPGTLGNGKILAGKLMPSKPVTPAAQPPKVGGAIRQEGVESASAMSSKALEFTPPDGHKITPTPSDSDTALLAAESMAGEVRAVKPQGRPSPPLIRRDVGNEGAMSAVDGKMSVLQAPNTVPVPMNAAPVVAEKAAVQHTSPTPASGAQVPARAQVAQRFDTGSVRVQKGDTAGKIALRAKTAEVSLEQMLVAMLRANPNAFIDGNINLIKAGALIKIPSQAEVQQTPMAEARQLIQAQSKDFNQYRQSLASNAPATPLVAAQRSDKGVVSSSAQESKLAAASPEMLTPTLATVQGIQSDAQLGQSANRQQEYDRAHAMPKNVRAMEKLVAFAGSNTPQATGSASSSAPAALPIASPAEPAVPAKPAHVQASLIDLLLDDPLVPAGTAGVIVLPMGWVVYRSRRRKKTDEMDKILAARAAYDPVIEPGDADGSTESSSKELSAAQVPR